MRLLIAARQSDLARLQARQVGSALQKAHPHLQIEFIFRESLGDREQNNPLWKMPEKGVFTEDFNQGLESREFDLVIHSWKDLPTQERPHSVIQATLPRADARDVLLVRKTSRAQKKTTWKVLSSSPRRTYFLQKAWNFLAPQGSPALEFHSVRGNIPTRLLKLQKGEGDALLVAKAALDRLLGSEDDEFASARKTLREVIDECDWMILPYSIDPPAPAQGALAIEILRGRPELEKILQAIHCEKTFRSVHWEREQLSQFGGGCHLKLGAFATEKNGRPLRILMGHPPEGEAFAKKWLERPSLANPSATSSSANSDFCALRSEDLFEIKKLNSSLAGSAFYISHQRALPEKNFSPEFLWTAGLKTWTELAQQGFWVNGSDESWGEERPPVDLLAGKKLPWQKLGHSKSSDAQMPLIPTYELMARSSVSEAVMHKITSASFFYWHSGLLFDRALELIPALRQKSHACGLGQTSQSLQAKLGSLQENQVFLDEGEWRMFYGAGDVSGLKRTL